MSPARLPQPSFDVPPLWPDASRLAQLRLTTPIPTVDLPRLRSAVFAIGEQHSQRDLTWLPRTRWAGFRTVSRLLREAGAVGVSCDRLDDAIAAAKTGLSAVTLLFPPLIGTGPETLVALSRQAAVTVVVDHFAQAERLASSCDAAGSSINLLLRIDVGRERLGVRPGPDLHDLAQGVSALSGVRLTGIAVDAAVSGPSGVSCLRPKEFARLLDRCRASLTRAGHAAHIISISHFENFGEPAEAGLATLQARTPLPGGPENPFAVMAGVIGRPTRNQAILDAGRDDLGSDAFFAGPAGCHARLLAIEDGFSVLHVDETGRDLVIGDVVALVPEHTITRMTNRLILVDDHGECRVESAVH